MLSPHPLQVTEQQLQRLVTTPRAAFPELEKARQDRATLEKTPQAQMILQLTQGPANDLQQLPPPATTYTAYRTFKRTGERRTFEDPYFLKRLRLTSGVLRLFFGQTALKDPVQDAIWDICEESTWVLPAHEPRSIDLFAAETGFLLAETLLTLGQTLDEEVRKRVYTEIEQRIFTPYLHAYRQLDWYQQANNWNGVCNSSVAATFLLLDTNPARLIQALGLALNGLQTFITTAFAEDGSSLEGVSYWHYGMCNFVALAELLRARSNGDIDLLTSEKMKRIAAFPAQLQLSSTKFASFSDCDETVTFHYGFIARLAERVAEPSLLQLLAYPGQPAIDWRLPMLLRTMLWWDGKQPRSILPNDAQLPSGGLARRVLPTNAGVPLVLAIKAGHNAEPHNHNDIGSFLLHIAGENLLTDPGRGLYSRDYFGPQRYANIFANSYGHSVPRIDSTLQGTGRTFAGTLLEDDPTADTSRMKRVAIEFAKAYACRNLKQARRELSMTAQDQGVACVWLRDHFEFTTPVHEVEEAFVTWLECTIAGATAHIQGQFYDLWLTIEQPDNLHFHLEYLEEQSKANQKKQILKRLSVLLPWSTTVDFSLQMVLHKR